MAAAILQIANIIGKQKEAQAWLSRYDKKAMQARASIGTLIGDKTLLILRIVGGKLRVYGTDRNIGCVLYQDLQINLPEEVKGIKWRKNIEMEELAKYEADFILIMCSSQKNDQQLWQHLQTSPVWQNCLAVRNHQWYPIDVFPWIDYSALSHELMIDHVVNLFVPSTKAPM
ncbi:ABC transporter substrate-binding protein [Paenibacillus sp. N3.4]|uniref:ABC transporter substrate-binding protein n=1 Tax=Paenibacillus sp. N3.4 TaxID=2603222 RepID=UPI0011CA5DC1|nr:ABC transporter substrate-binding protein [Paenibacillus sp. N3.4]TXK77029.1 ABC transporter substrate-binding protein [Paenibacillus sp. N3.4]